MSRRPPASAYLGQTCHDLGVEPSPGYRELSPPPAAQAVVECFWTRVPRAAGEVRVVPDGCVDVVWRRGWGTLVAGPDTTAKLMRVAPDELLVGMRFRPGAGGAALALPLDELRDLRVDASDVRPALAAADDARPDQVLAGFTAAAAGLEPDPLVAAAAQRLATGGDVAAVARDLAISERQLLRRFKAAAGYGPKTLARILRFRRLVAALDAGDRDLAALAFALGYADQAHLTHETTRLAGVPPGRLAADRRPQG